MAAAPERQMYKQRTGGSIIYMGSVHSKEASPLKAPYVTAKHGLIGLAKVVAKEGAKHGVRANVICPGFVRTPLVDKQIPEQARELGISQEEVAKNVMPKETVDGEFTTVPGRRRSRAVSRRLRVERPHGPVARGQSWLVHEVKSRPLGYFAGVPVGAWASGIRIWMAVVVALAASFWLELDAPATAASAVAILQR